MLINTSNYNRLVKKQLSLAKKGIITLQDIQEQITSVSFILLTQDTPHGISH